MTDAGEVAVRTWARATGFTIADGEPIPATVVDAYAAAHQGPAASRIDLSAWSAPRELSPVAPPSIPPPTWPPPPTPEDPPQQTRTPRRRGKRDRFSVASLVSAVIPLSGGITAIVFGLIALLRIRKSGKRGRGMAITGIVLGTCWLVGLTALLAAYRVERRTDGEVTSRGGALILELRGGDCLASMPRGRSRGVDLVPCREPHAGEVYAAIPIEGSRFPGTSEVTRFAEGACPSALVVRVIPGVPEIETSYLVPSALSWRVGHRHVLCLLSGRNGAILPGGSIGTP